MDDIDHLGGFVVAGVLNLQTGFVVSGQNDLHGFTAEGFGVGFEDAFRDVEKDIENALDFNGTTFGVNAYGSYSGGGMLGGIGGTTFGTVNINIDGYNAQDDDELAEMIAEKLQFMAERRGAVFA